MAAGRCRSFSRFVLKIVGAKRVTKAVLLHHAQQPVLVKWHQKIGNCFAPWCVQIEKNAETQYAGDFSKSELAALAMSLTHEVFDRGQDAISRTAFVLCPSEIVSAAKTAIFEQAGVTERDTVLP